jgi:DMSO/TMAO reductase YedYZ molybdopterin-dependent catalytic subunit
MTIDRYTKFILTVIAAALCIGVVQRATAPAYAAPTASADSPAETTGRVLRVAICDPNKPDRCAKIYQSRVESPGDVRFALGVSERP